MSEKARLYGEARVVFGGQEDTTTRRTRFGAPEGLYDSLRRYWGLQRGPALAGASETFEMLERCRALESVTNLDLLTLEFDSPSTAQALSTYYGQMRRVKANNEFPWVAASKFLHFLHPRLIPIWDWKYVNNRITNGRPFGRQFSDFCRTRDKLGFSATDRTERFSVAYTFWAAALIQSAPDSLMPLYADWAATQAGKPGDAAASVRGDFQECYAGAFEMIAIGATFL